LKRGAIVALTSLTLLAVWLAVVAFNKANETARMAGFAFDNERQLIEETQRQSTWYYLHRLCHSDLRTLKGHMDRVTGVAFSPDGRRIDSASSDHLWCGVPKRVRRPSDASVDPTGARDPDSCRFPIAFGSTSH
jgi:WD40 repeat protein